MDKIEIMPNIYLTNDYALYLDDGIIAIADLHLGYEAVLQAQGVSIPKFQKKIIMNRLRNILQKYEPELIVVNGDFKHEFSRNLWQEWEEVREVLALLTKKAEVVLVRGNHDNYLKTITSKLNVPLVKRYSWGNLTFVHGHEKVKQEGHMVLGHDHPSLKLRDAIGASIKLPCFLFNKKEKIIVLPAISPLATGTNVVHKSKFLSPLLNEVDMSSSDVYAISEIGLLDFKKIRDLTAL